MYDYILKFIIVGNSSVGKSTILLRFTDNRFRSSHDLTIGVEFATKIVSINNIVYKLQIWDTAGQESFRSITQSYYRGTLGCLIVYDVNDRESFESLSFWIENVKNQCDPNITIVLVGNKIDLSNTRKVTTDEAREFATKHNIAYFETSAKDDTNISKCFSETVDIIGKKIESTEIKLVASKGTNKGNILIDIPIQDKSTCLC